MSITFYPTQLGFIPSGTIQVSSVTIGRNVSGTYEAIGFGSQGRPDYAELVQIYLTQRATDGTLTNKGVITLNVGDLISAKTTNPNVPTNLNLTLREVAVCDAGQNKRMIIIGSQTYSP